LIKIQNTHNLEIIYDEELGFQAKFRGFDDFRFWTKRDPTGWYDLNGIYQGGKNLPYNNSVGIKFTAPKPYISRAVKDWRSF
jgi:hypothetical protein